MPASAESVPVQPDPTDPGYLNSHFVWRVTRQLLQDGKAVPTCHCLWVPDPTSAEKVVLGALSRTANTIVFWPSVRSRQMRAAANESCVIDHATLSLSKGRSHLTGYDVNDQRCRPKRHRSSVVPLGDSGYSVWLMCAAKWVTLRAQLGNFEGLVKLPPSDTARRTCEWAEIVSSTVWCPVAVPLAPSASDFVVFDIGVVASPDKVKRVASPCPDVADIVDGFMTPGQVGLSVMRVGDVHIGVRTWLPEGVLHKGVWLGLPRARQ